MSMFGSILSPITNLATKAGSTILKGSGLSKYGSPGGWLDTAMNFFGNNWQDVAGAASSAYGAYTSHKDQQSAFNLQRDQQGVDREQNRLNLDFGERWNQAAQHFAGTQFNWNKQPIQNAVNDAKIAGIHPLYALGAQGSGSVFNVGGAPGGTSSSSGVVPPSGSGLGSAFRALAGSVSRSATANRLDKANSETHAAQIAKLNSETFLNESMAASTIKRAEAEVNHARVTPLTESVPLAKRPVDSPNRQSHAFWIEYIRDDGSKAWGINPELELETLPDIVVAINEAKHSIGKQYDAGKKWLNNKLKRYLK